MAEPAGILIEAHIEEEKLASFFERPIAHGSGIARVGHVLSEILDQGDTYGEILIVNHDPQCDSLFLAWILSRYAPEAAAPIWPILEALADHLGPSATAQGAVTSTLPECLEFVQIENGRLIRDPRGLVSSETLQRLSTRLWSFASNDEFPDAVRSMRRRNYHCKAFRTAWQSYLKWRDEQERPARISAATEAKPFRLFHDIYCWDSKVVDRDGFTDRDIPFPGADPLSFRLEAGFYADKNHVWQQQLAQNSPPARITSGNRTINNPQAIWEYVTIPDVNGSDFTWFDSRRDTMFWADKRRIYALDDGRLIPLPGVNASEFKMFGQCFGTDGKAVFWGAKRLPLKPERLRTESYFIWDDEKVFMTANEVPLSGQDFRILGQKHVAGTGGGLHFRLADAYKTIILGPNNTCLPDDPLF